MRIAGNHSLVTRVARTKEGAKVIIAGKPGHPGCQNHEAKVRIAGHHRLVTRVARFLQDFSGNTFW